jgi:hypothetical protein
VDDTWGVKLSAATPLPRRLGIAVAALATAVAVILPAGAAAAPASFAAKGGATASRALGNGHGAKASKRKRGRRSHRAPAAAKKPAKAKAQTDAASSSGTGGAATGSTQPAPAPSSPAKPTKPAKPAAGTTATPPWTGTTTTPPPSTGTTTPPPTGSTAPPTTGPELLFSGSRIGDFALLQEAPNAITEVPDPLGSGESVLKMTVGDRDVAPITPTENPRAQALSPDIINQGQEFWLSTKFLLPADFPTIPGWMSLVSIYGAPFNGSSPWQIEVAGNNLQWARNASYGWDVPWQAPVARGQWTTILLHEKFSGSGFVEMWVNGQPVTFFSPGSGYNPSRHAATQHLEMKTVDGSNNGGANAAKIMQYRKAGMFQSASVYFGALKVGSTRTAVGG